jgi:hypothetical protein
MFLWKQKTFLESLQTSFRGETEIHPGRARQPNARSWPLHELPLPMQDNCPQRFIPAMRHRQKGPCIKPGLELRRLRPGLPGCINLRVGAFHTTCRTAPRPHRLSMISTLTQCWLLSNCDRKLYGTAWVILIQPRSRVDGRAVIASIYLQNCFPYGCRL